MEQRSEARIESHIRFFVHVHECDERPELIGTSIACEAVDLSVHGLQFHTDSHIPMSAILNVTIGVADPFAMYLLQGEVRWSRTTDTDCFVGVLLTASEGTDFATWTEEFDGLFS